MDSKTIIGIIGIIFIIVGVTGTIPSALNNLVTWLGGFVVIGVIGLVMAIYGFAD